ncbi:MAG: tetratricopeptide repeat protein, partial [Peptostreptococcaceae bacterium]
MFYFIPSKGELIINEIKQSYEGKVDLTPQQIEDIKRTTYNKKYLNGEDNFMLGYINLFAENNSELAYKYFEEVIKKESTTKEEFAIVYSYKFLAQKYIEEGNINKGIIYTKKALYSINPKEHGEYRNLINDILRPVLELREGRDLAIDFLEYILIENYKHQDKQAELYAYRTLEEIYMSKGNYTQSAQMSIKAIKLAEELGKEFFRGKSLINLARVHYKADGHEAALEILKRVKDIKAEDAEWNDKLNNLRLLVLYQINLSLEQYDDALYIANEFDNYKSNLTDEDRSDIEIIQNILMAHIYVTKGNLDSAKVYLDKASEIMKVDEVVYW